MNILFLTVDDLRPQLACYGVEWMKTPNLDRLAASGTLFERAYSQFPICGPSRASIHSGLRPTATRFSRWNARIDQDTPDVLTLPGHFLNNGYATQCLGKVFHDIDEILRGNGMDRIMPIRETRGQQSFYLHERVTDRHGDE